VPDGSSGTTALPRTSLTVVFALPGVFLYDGIVQYVCVFCVLLATVYALVRRRVPEYVGRFVE
jgi:hypothetical protein